MSKMTDYTGRIFGSIIIRSLANFNDVCEHKPHRVEQVGTVNGKAEFVYKHPAYRGRRYWLWACVACKRSGMIRADIVKKWAENGHQCRCRDKQHKEYSSFKTCKYLNHKLPATRVFFYQTKAGYLSTNCRACSRIIAVGKRDTIPCVGVFGFGVKYDAEAAGGQFI